MSYPTIYDILEIFAQKLISNLLQQGQNKESHNKIIDASLETLN